MSPSNATTAQARFDSLDEWLHTDIRGWTLAEHIDDDQFARLQHGPPPGSQQFVGGDGQRPFRRTRADRHGHRPT